MLIISALHNTSRLLAGVFYHALGASRSSAPGFSLNIMGAAVEEVVAHTPLTIKYLRKTAPWKFEGRFSLSIYVSSTSAPRMDHNDRIDWEQNTTSACQDGELNRDRG